MSLECRVLGSFELTTSGGHRPLQLESRKARELVALLLTLRTRSISRDRVAVALWPAKGAKAARKQLRQAMWHVHNVLDAAEPDQDRLIVTRDDHLAVNGSRETWCDASRFATDAERCLDDGLGVSARRLTHTIALYRGPLLDGCFSEWCLVERERLDALYLSVLDLATCQAERRHDASATIRWAFELLRNDPAHERSHRRLMRLYYESGDRTRALRQYEQCTRALQDELGVAPASRTSALAAAILADAPAPSAADDGTAVVPSPALGGADAGRDPESNTSPQLLRELAALRTAVERLSELVLAGRPEVTSETPPPRRGNRIRA